jgi:hypothetical protein
MAFKVPTSVVRQGQQEKERQRIAAGGYDPSKIQSTENPYDPNLYNVNFSRTPTGQVSQNLYNADPSVRLAQTYLNQYYHGDGRVKGMPGTYKNYENEANKVALKRSLAQSISDAPKNLQEELGLLRGEAGQAIGSGVRKTRENFSSRGLLYSGLRQGGEASVKGRVASALAESEAGARRETRNLMDQRKAAFAAIGLQDQEAKNRLAQETFEKSYQNSIARRQAIQQLGQGVGQALGYYYGSSAQDNQAIRPSSENMSISPVDYSGSSYATRAPRMSPQG